ncbi:DEAD/DEAH box helicase [Paenibacillus physcomitrellae]|uniref:Helicase SNF n=1 Tax=Paenibacillus physcomitrellae TaxID=1619311 RepID=A0ABQ1FYN6_9BACL|nr:DEAD/DEAH box helicase [Paenibacillus physcomitrellae]GGA33957.1 helicase SNF [Paenibacillus physcomitrellae]
MNVKLTKKSIKQWCGAHAYQKGERINRGQKVSFVQFEEDTGRYTAEITHQGHHEVQLDFEGISQDGRPEAVCSCPTLDSYDAFCCHIAAVLLRLYELHQADNDNAGFDREAGALPAHAGVVRSALQTSDGRIPSAPSALGLNQPENRAGSPALAERLLGLFEDKPVRPVHNRTLVETRNLLQVEFIVKLLEFYPYTFLFGIELKVGPKSLYIVKNIASFLDQLRRGESAALSPRFSYDPELHSFAAEDEAILQLLGEGLQDRALYRETDRLGAIFAPGASSGRQLLLPPQVWKSLLPLLLKAPKVTLMDGERKYEGISVSEEPLPLRFELDKADSGSEDYEWLADGLERIKVLEPYRLAFLEGRLLPLSSKTCKQLAELKAILEEGSSKGGSLAVRIPGSHIEAFMKKAVPGFKRLGSVSIAPAVAEKVTQVPLQAKLYLDRVRDRLLAAVEFQYDTVVINPLEEERAQPGSHRILVRDAEREQQILDILEQQPFTKTEAGYYMDEEESEFHFLYTVVPQLEKLLKVYATTAVKIRVHKLDELPKVSLQVSATETLNWLEFRLNMGWIPETEIRSLIKSLEEKRRYYRLPSGSLLPLDSGELQEMAEFLKETGLLHHEIEGSTIRLPLTRGLPFISQGSGSEIVKLDRPVRQLLENLRNPDNLDFPVPASLSSVLRDYQTLGYQWLKTLAYYGFGGILADDMGLGKTLQSIAYIASVLPEIRQQNRPALVISPGSLIYNWRDELRKFAPDIRVLIADGTQTERSAKLRRLEEVDIVVTSYPLLLRDQEQYAKEPFHTLILDEAQAFKNPGTQTARAVKSIQAGFRFALTGTPVENRLEELWSIFHVVFPALFQDLKTFGNLTRKEVAKRAKPFMLRRWKRDVLQDLPEKIESMKPAELLPEQKKLYAAYLAKLQQDTLKHLSVDGYQKSRIKILAGLTRLRQICCHPALFVEGYKGSSAKLEQLMEIVEEGRANRKRMLIFSQFTEMLGLIGGALDDVGVPYFYLDGSTPVRERVELCRRFNEGEMDVFLISMKAGGTGLNLTGADTVILYDLWWNPAVEQQAADRAHRMGQKEVVQVIRLIAKDTMEEKMYELQHNKKQLIDEVMGQGGEAVGGASLTEQELREILRL